MSTGSRGTFLSVHIFVLIFKFKPLLNSLSSSGWIASSQQLPQLLMSGSFAQYIC